MFAQQTRLMDPDFSPRLMPQRIRIFDPPNRHEETLTALVFVRVVSWIVLFWEGMARIGWKSAKSAFVDSVSVLAFARGVSFVARISKLARIRAIDGEQITGERVAVWCL